MKRNTKLALALTAGTAIGALLAHRYGRRQETSSEQIAAPDALMSSAVRKQAANWMMSLLPPRATVLVMSDDRGDLAHDISSRCRMVFSADGAGGESAARVAWPENIIRTQCDLNGLWLADQSLDAAMLANVLQQYEDVSPALEQLGRVLKPGGYLMLLTSVRPDNLSDSAWRSTMELLGIPARHTWNAQELQELLEAEGWQIFVRQTFTDGIPLVCMVCRGKRA